MPEFLSVYFVIALFNCTSILISFIIYLALRKLIEFTTIYEEDSFWLKSMKFAVLIGLLVFILTTFIWVVRGEGIISCLPPLS